MMKKYFALFALCLSMISYGVCSAKEIKATKKESGTLVGGALMTPSKNIVENAINSKDHTTLVTAVKAGSLVETLSSPGPFTVFAPTNEAFSKLPEGTVESLLKEENKTKLVDVLTYHVVPGAIKAKDLKDGQTLKTVEGKELKVTKTKNTITINGAKVEIADVISSNGVTYVIDSVLLP
ncbi:MAG: fasciclin domain-containing protein [Candidatus Caenarcaniphilales bacterium]|nr:fasciclin domain-containing protein [Candidatus Caenarcaniphilales bacterium]